MKSFVITIMGNDASCEVAERCIQSGKQYGIEIEKFAAVTPADKPLIVAQKWGIPTSGFQEVYSRYENCVAAFLSHYSLWDQCVKDNQPYTIFEHDAVITGPLPYEYSFSGGVMNIGKPSYGKYKTPTMLGINKLFSKPYFPGAHAYMVTPNGAKKLIDAAKRVAKPTDVFMNLKDMPWLQEYYPWIAEAKDTFTTIQKPEGCFAKHNYNDKYKII